ncbi:MAG: hypothetical protein H7Z73_00010 [Candidatus Saccharibacteria bacterium]|nr:hypothetical protein [Moraxellaceae bacterium]
MLKLIIICVFLYVVIRLILRFARSESTVTQAPIELKACVYCGLLVRVDQAVVLQGRLFCSQDHANRMR